MGFPVSQVLFFDKAQCYVWCCAGRVDLSLAWSQVPKTIMEDREIQVQVPRTIEVPTTKMVPRTVLVPVKVNVQQVITETETRTVQVNFAFNLFPRGLQGMQHDSC
jgi:hypothetical protein